jgi:hypothetical protein
VQLTPEQNNSTLFYKTKHTDTEHEKLNTIILDLQQGYPRAPITEHLANKLHITLKARTHRTASEDVPRHNLKKNGRTVVLCCTLGAARQRDIQTNVPLGFGKGERGRKPGRQVRKHRNAEVRVNNPWKRASQGSLGQ